METEQAIAEIRAFISSEKEQWTEHRDRQIPMGNCWEAYNGRIWMLNCIQGKLKKIIHKHRRQEAKNEKRNIL